MSVAFNLLIATARLDLSPRCPQAGFRHRRTLNDLHEFKKLALRPGGVHPLVRGNEISNGALRLQGLQRVGHALVIDRGKEEGGVELACFHIAQAVSYTHLTM